MQPFLLVDYLDRTKISNNTHLDSLALFCKLTKYMTIINEREINVNFKDEFPIVEGLSLREFLPLLQNDESMKVFLRTYKAYEDRPHKNYIIEKNLVKALGETKLDIKPGFLPKNLTGFIDLKDFFDNDGDWIRGVFFDVKDDPFHMLYLGYIAYDKNLKSYTVAHLNIPLDDPDKSLEEVIKEHKEVVCCREVYEKAKRGEKLSLSEVTKTEVTQATYHSHVHTILNSILYIHHSPQLCIEELNIFHTKKSKLKAQKGIYTSKKFIVLGKDFNFPKEYTCGTVGVSGHFRWQPYGEGRSLIKHIYIKPHQRTYN